MINNARYINLLLASFFVLMIGFVLFTNKLYKNYEKQQTQVENTIIFED